MTKNHGYNTPKEGSNDWHIPLNENFENIDRDIEIRDSQSNLDDYEPKAGAKFFATDSEEIYIGDGSDWNVIASSGKQPSFDSITTKKLSGDVAGNGNEISNIDGNLYIQSDKPSDPKKNDIWIDTS